MLPQTQVAHVTCLIANNFRLWLEIPRHNSSPVSTNPPKLGHQVLATTSNFMLGDF